MKPVETPEAVQTEVDPYDAAARWSRDSEKPSGLNRMNLFHSARLKLTAFYFAVLAVFCLLLTFGVHAFTDYELHQGDAARSGAVYKIFDRLYGPDVNSPMPASGRYFESTEQRQSDLTAARLNRDFLLIDLGLLAAGAVLSYWFAGRTLRPIERAHEEQKRFTADASHELKTPLASMKLENEVFLRQKHFDEKDARQLISSNLEEVGRLERLATSLLSLNQYEHGTVMARPLDAVQLVQDAIEQAKRDGHGTEAEFIVTAQSATVQGDSDSLTELLSILFDNAVKYGPPHGPIEVNGQTNDGSYSLSVRDHGPGIPAEDLPHIFERMYRGDKARSSKIGGHGIGLSLARQIAVANQGSLTATNHAEGGAVFTLTLPR